MKQCIEYNADGIYHVAGAEAVSRYEFAIRIADVFGFDPELISKVKSSDLPQLAQRPLHTTFVVDKAKRTFMYNPMNITQGLKLLQEELTGIHLN